MNKSGLSQSRLVVMALFLTAGPVWGKLGTVGLLRNRP